jgi:anti-sigma B factor antagonist
VPVSRLLPVPVVGEIRTGRRVVRLEGTLRTPPILQQTIGSPMTTFEAAFEVETRREAGRAIVIPSGELDLATVDRLGAAIDGLVDSGFKTVVLDLRRLTFIDSTGLRLIAGVSRRSDVRLRLIDGIDDVTGLFEICRVRAWLSFMNPRELRRSPAY